MSKLSTIGNLCASKEVDSEPKIRAMKEWHEPRGVFVMRFVTLAVMCLLSECEQKYSNRPPVLIRQVSNLSTLKHTTFISTTTLTLRPNFLGL